MGESHAIKIHLLSAYNASEIVGGKKTSNVWNCLGGQGLTFH